MILNKQPGSMTILWQTDKTPALSEIHWGLTPNNYSKSSGELQEYGDHQFSYSMGGLPPRIRVYYLVRVDDGMTTGSFMTPPSLSATKLTFYGYGDPQGEEDLLTDRQYVCHSLVERQMMNDVNQDPSVRQTIVLGAGDFVSCGLVEEYWDQQYFNRNLFYSMDFQANLPIMATIGNHEGYLPGRKGTGSLICAPPEVDEPQEPPDCWILDTANAGKLFYKYFPYSFYPETKGPGNYRDYYYFFDYGPVRFIALDSFYSRLETDSPQYLWASRAVSDSRPWNIMRLHGNLWSPKSSGDLRASLCPLFEAKRIPLVLQGHLHYYSRCLVNGIIYLTLGNGGAPLNDPFPYDPSNSPYVIKAAMCYHFARFEISGNTMAVTVMDNNGQIVDSFKILPAAISIFPVGGALAPNPPTLTASPFLSQDGATHHSSQWIVRHGVTNQIVYITNSNGVPTFSTRNLTSFTVPKGRLKPAHKYKWQVIYKDSKGNTTQPSPAADFMIRETYVLDPAKIDQ